MTKKLFVFDCDGTLVNDQREIVPTTLNTLNKALDMGHKVAICTGRTLKQIDRYLVQIPKLDLAATMNGSVVDDLTNKETYYMSKPVGKDIVKMMLEVAQEYKRELHWCSKDEIYRVYFGTTPANDITDQTFFKMGTPNPHYDSWEDVKDKINIDILHIAIKMETSLIAKPFELIHDKYSDLYSIVKTGDVYIDVNAKNVNKFSAVQKIQSLCNINNKNTYCFGDSDNDFSMLSQAGHGICMGNGTILARQSTNIHIGDNNSNAISEYIEKILLED